jgi:hypothetical protein
MTGKADIRKWDKKKKRNDSRNTVNSYQESRATKFTPQGSGNSELIRPQSAGDLNMNTFDIINLDRMIFATDAGAGDDLAITETGIEAIATGAAAYGMKYQVPANKIHQFFIGTSEKINITTGVITLNDNVVGGGSVQLSAMTAPSATGTTQRKLYVDSADNHLKIRTNTSSIDLETSSGGGAGLGDNNTWTGTNAFTNTVTVEDASFGIRDQSDNTKVANFQCSGISSGTTRTYTLPDASTSLAGLGVISQTWTGTNGFAGITNINGTATFDTLATYSGTVPVKLQGDGNNTTQTVTEIGKYGAHGVKIIAEILGDTGRSMTNPDGGSDIPVPGTNEPALSIKGAMIMNTYTMYDLDTLVFSQGVSSTTPPPENDWVYIEANTGSSGSPSLTGMTYNVPTSKTHQFKVNGSLKVSIDDDIEFAVGSTLEIQNTIANPTSLSAGAAIALPSAPAAYFKVHYNGADRYIPYYT